MPFAGLQNMKTFTWPISGDQRENSELRARKRCSPLALATWTSPETHSNEVTAPWGWSQERNVNSGLCPQKSLAVPLVSRNLDHTALG